MNAPTAPGGLNLSRRLRRTPYTHKVEALGVRGFSVVNHMLLPKAFQHSVEEDYWHLRTDAQLWDVACQRQVEIRGTDAARLVQWMTPRNIARAKVGDCLYVPLVNQFGGMVNDPILLKLANDHFWLSIADSDVLLWASGLALGAGLDVAVCEPDVSPLAVQGPRAEDLLSTIFGDAIRKIGFFKFARFDFMGSSQIIARSGYSSQDGFEIYLHNSELGAPLWDCIWEAGQAFNLRPGCPNLIDRIEAGLLSFGNDMTSDNNPLECGMSALCDLDATADNTDSIGLPALRAIAATDITQQIRGLLFAGDGDPCPTCASPWLVFASDSHQPNTQIGVATSAIYSPRLHANIALAMIGHEFWQPGQPIRVLNSDGKMREGVVTALPLT